jgi:YggT family protein
MHIIGIVDIIFQAYFILLLIRILGSWIPEVQQYKAFQFVTFYTDPFLNLFRRIIPPLGMIDISPIIAFFVLGIVQNAIKSLIMFFLR